MTEEVALRLEGLTKYYGSVTGVERVDLEIRRGEFFTLLGPSGSGKSTTLLLIAGFEVPTAGEVYLDGLPLTGVPPHKRRIGIVFQSYALFPHLTVFENVAFALRNLRWSEREIRARVTELLGLVKLDGFEGRLPAQLSGGQQQRIALARALAFRPTVLLLDEPLGALDRKLREHMLMEFRRIHRMLSTTMVYVTHDQDEALVMSERVGVMNHGRLVRVGTPRELYEDPIDPFIADFLGETNILSGIVHKVGVLTLDDCEGTISIPRNTQVGSRVRVVVRPEKIIIGAASTERNVTRGRIEEIVYLGEATKYLVRTVSGRPLLVKQLNRQMVPTYDAGSNVTLSWDPSDCRVVEEAK